MAHVLGIDIGGSGVKGAPVDVDAGELLTDRLRIDTPLPATPDAVADVVSSLVDAFEWSGLVGCTFPGVVRSGVVKSAANVDDAWIDTDARSLLETRCGLEFHVVNDADAAGVGEVDHGAARGISGVVVMVTLGTGIGSALFVDGVLVPNTEFGHIMLDGVVAESVAASRWRKRENLSWEEWALRVGRYLRRLEFLLSPDLFVIGGGVSRRHDRFFPYLETTTPVVPAALQNSAGIIGAASLAARRLI